MRELTIRRIAQWAVNCVDFRDADGTMTPFEYDVNPFDGWGWTDFAASPVVFHAIDGDITTDDRGPNFTDGLTPTYPPHAAANPERRVVWGCENPELLITEAVAFHDKSHEGHRKRNAGALAAPVPSMKTTTATLRRSSTRRQPPKRITRSTNTGCLKAR